MRRFGGPHFRRLEPLVGAPPLVVVARSDRVPLEVVVVLEERRVGPAALRTSRQYWRCRFLSAVGLSAWVCILHCLLASSKSMFIVNLGIYVYC